VSSAPEFLIGAERERGESGYKRAEATKNEKIFGAREKEERPIKNQAWRQRGFLSILAQHWRRPHTAFHSFLILQRSWKSLILLLETSQQRFIVLSLENLNNTSYKRA
jgi:hypothetical protein